MKLKNLMMSLVVMFTSISFAQSKLPNVTLKDLLGKNVSVSAYNNSSKPVIVSFWATWCGPCIKELNAIRDQYDKWQKEFDVELVAVSIDDAKTAQRVKPMVANHKWKYTVLLDGNQEFKRAMNVANPPYLVIVHKGKIVYSHSGYAPGIENEIYAELKKLK